MTIIIDACLKYNISRLIYTSTVHALPESQEGNIVESKEFDLERIEGAYARTKAEATIRILSATQKGLNAVVCYPSAVIGPYDFRGSEAGKMIRDYATNKIPAYIHGAYNFVDVRDVVNGLLLAQSKAKSGDSYILAGERMTLKQFFIILASLEPKVRMPKICIPVFLALSFAWILERVCLLISVKPFFTVYGIKVLQSNSNISSIKAIQELGYQARPIKESIADSLKWYKSNGLL